MEMGSKNQVMSESSESDLWRLAEASFESALGLEHAVLADPVVAKEILGAGLRHAVNRGVALRALSHVSPELTIELVEDVVKASTSHRDAMLAREVLARLPYQTCLRHVAPVVARSARQADGEDLRRYAELLDHLGLAEALSELAALALQSDDLDIREVGEDYAEPSGS